MSTLASDRIDDDPLAQRLAALPVATPVFRRLAATVPQTAIFVGSARRRRALRTRWVLAVAVALAGIAAVYSTVGEDGLRWAGLRPQQVQPLTGTATRGSARLTVTGGYADEINTVLLIGRENTDCTPFLTDQFGQRYDIVGGGGGPGPYPAFFEPLRARAATVGARVTVHCDQMAIGLSGTLSVHSSHSIPAPAAIVVDGTTYAVVGLRWSGTYLEVHTIMSGKLIDELETRAEGLRPPSKPTLEGVSFPGVFVAKGGVTKVPVAVLNGRTVGDKLRSDRILDEVRVFTVSDAGTYSIVVAFDPNGPALASWTVEVR